MAVIVGVPSPVGWSVKPALVAQVNTDPSHEPVVTMQPLRLAVYEPDPYRMLRGWPQEVPEFDVRSHALVSADGERVEYRPDPSNVTTTAAVRWVADPDYYSPISGRWTPITDAYRGSSWLTGAEYAPVMTEEFSYRVGKTVLFRDALNFSQSANDHMWSDFAPSLTGMFGYTVLMVVSLRSSYNVVDVTTAEYAGLLCPGSATPPSSGGNTFAEPADEGAPSLHLRDGGLWARTSPTSAFRKLLDTASLRSSTRPAYLAYTVGYPELKVYLGAGPNSLRSAAISYPTPYPQNLALTLGRSTGELQHSANMLLFDIGLYTHQLSDNEVTAEVATLSAAYGGS